MNDYMYVSKLYFYFIHVIGRMHWTISQSGACLANTSLPNYIVNCRTVNVGNVKYVTLSKLCATCSMNVEKVDLNNAR